MLVYCQLSLEQSCKFMFETVDFRGTNVILLQNLYSLYPSITSNRFIGWGTNKSAFINHPGWKIMVQTKVKYEWTSLMYPTLVSSPLKVIRQNINSGEANFLILLDRFIFYLMWFIFWQLTIKTEKSYFSRLLLILCTSSNVLL